jgi:phosphoesterase RecJ-like protein
LEFDRAAELLQAAQTIIIVTHVRPDGDAIGSLCGLGLALREMGKRVTLAVDDGVNDYLSFVPGSETVQANLYSPQADLVISCDASDLERTGEVGATAFGLAVPKLVIDHHATNTLFGDVHLVHSDYVSTTEAIYHLLRHLGRYPFSLPVATALMVGFMTDTISFRVGPVTSTTLQQVADLMEMGVNLRHVIERMLIRLEPGQLQLMGQGLAHAEVQGHVIWASLRLEDLRAFGLGTGEKPELSTELLRDKRAYIACFFLETEEGDIRLSFRAKPGFDVGSIAFGLGGGGHTLAAGATIRQSSIEAAIAQVIPLLQAEAQRGKPLYGGS